MCRLLSKELFFSMVALLLVGVIAAAPLLERADSCGSLAGKEVLEEVDSDSENLRTDVELVGMSSGLLETDSLLQSVFATWLSADGLRFVDGVSFAHSQRGPPAFLL